MTSLLGDRKVDVHILYRSKFDGRKIWAQDESSIDSNEATLKQYQGNTYVMEVSERGVSKTILQIDFRKIKSYTMRARCWHEVKYEGRLIALRFTESETFDDFYTTLERVLIIYKKFRKPKNDEAFLREVEMFQLKQLKPIGNVRRERAISLGSTEQDSPSSRGTVQGSKTRVTNPSRSLDIFKREGLPRPPDPLRNKKQVKMNQNPPPTLQKPKKPSKAVGGSSLNRLPPQLPPKSKPEKSPPTVPPPRMSRDYENIQQGAELLETGWESDTSDEEIDEENSSNYTAGTIYGSMDDEAFEPPPPLPIRVARSSMHSTVSASTEPSHPGDNRQKQPKPSNNDEVSGSPPGSHAPKLETPTHSKPHDPTMPSTLSPIRDKRPPTGQPAEVKTGPQITPNQLPKRHTDPKRQDFPDRSGPSHPPTPTTPPVQPTQLPSAIYGTATQWICYKCTLRNEFWKLTCAACEWMRTDAWGCEDCATVYSNDVTRCFTCDVWRCRLCTMLNRGEQSEMTLCQGCGQ